MRLKHSPVREVLQGKRVVLVDDLLVRGTTSRKLVKMVRGRVEESKVTLRNHRREALDDMRQLEQEKLIGEDDLRRGLNRVRYRASVG